MRTKTYVYLALWTAFIAACAYMMPYFSNDYRYMLVQGSDLPVESLKDIAVSQWAHYFEWGGRTVAHVIAQLLLYFGKPTSAVLNGACYATAMVAMIALARGTSFIKAVRTLEFMPLFIVSMALWLCLRIFGEVVFMPVSSSNYLYTTTIILLFLLPYAQSFLNSDQERGGIFAVLYMIAGVLAGWTNENTGAAALACTFLALLVFFKEHRLRLWQLAGAVGLFVGYLLLMLSPGNNARLQSMEDGGFTFWGHFPSAVEIYFATLLTQLPLLLACVFCIYRIVKSGVLKKDALARRNWYVAWWLFLAGFLSLTVMLASPNFPNRSSAPFTFFTSAFLCALYVLAKRYGVELLPRRISLALCALCVIYLAPTVVNTAAGYHTAMLDGRKRDLEIASQLAEGKRDLVVSPFRVKTSKYMFIGDVRAVKTYFANNIVKKFYKVDSIRRSCNYEIPWYSYDYMIFADHSQPVCTGDRGDPEDPSDELNRKFLKDHPEQIATLKFKKDGSYTRDRFIKDMQDLGLLNVGDYMKKQ